MSLCVCVSARSVMDGQKASKPYHFNYYERWLVMTINRLSLHYVCVYVRECVHAIEHCYPFHIDRARALARLA